MGQRHKRFRNFGRHIPCATSAKILAAMCSKNRKIVVLEMARAYGLRPRLWLLSDLIPLCLNSSDLPNCGHPGNQENAVLVHSTYWAGDYVRYLCNPGYTMFGPAVRRCLPSGNWSGNGVQCKNFI